MKYGKKLAAVAAVLFLLGLWTPTVFAAEPQKGYSYKITLHAGNQGAIDGVPGGSMTVEAEYGDGKTRVSFDLSRIQVLDDRYYMKGIRLSGRDNGEAAQSFYVTGDADYVVAYGIKGDQVAYRVKYQDASGHQLAPDDTFYGNVGDKPVVAYRYVSGYVPQALALTGTLNRNETENVFTFVYTPGESGQLITVAGEDQVNLVTVVTTETTAADGTGSAGSETAGETPDNGAGEGGADTEEQMEVVTPEELIDLDENETPGGNIDLSGESEKAFPLAAAVTVGAAALAALLVLLLLIRKRMKDEQA